MESRLIGRVVGRRFRVEDVIGRGGMAIVYRAFDLKQRQTVALKVLREEYEDDPEYKERFRREASVNRRLNHPNIVNAIGSGETDGISYIALEYVDGDTLKEIIARQGRMEPEEAVRYTLCILAGLFHAHQRGVIHRDIKPQNVMVTRSGQVKIADFGIAGVADTKTLTSDGSVIGSVHYFSPEQAKGMRATEASDLYAVGVMLYEMLTGHVPFDGETAVSVAMMHLMEAPRPVEQEAKVSPAIALIVKKALEKEPDDRYASADQMMRDLRRALRHPDGAFMMQQTMRQRVHRRKAHSENERTNRAFARAVMGILIVVLLGIVGLTGRALYRSVFVLTRMPDLTGVDAATAERLIAGARLQAQLSYAYSDVMEGYVSGQIPRAGDQVNRGETVYVTISRGSGMLPVPRYIGMTQDNAFASIAAQGFSVGEVTLAPSDQLAGTVIAQQPEAGTALLIGSPVGLTVSGGRVVVPELTGLREEEAIRMIESLGLTCTDIAHEEVSDDRMDGVVLSQSLERFSEVLPGSGLALRVGHYDKRRYSAQVKVVVDVPREGVNVRVTLVGEDGKESDMYAVTCTEPGEATIDVLLRSEKSGVQTWRVYLDGGFKSEATAVLQ